MDDLLRELAASATPVSPDKAPVVWCPICRKSMTHHRRAKKYTCRCGLVYRYVMYSHGRGPVVCFECQTPMASTSGRDYWKCQSTWCKYTQRAGPNGLPIPIKSTPAVRQARSVAHHSLDRYWLSGMVTRSEAYVMVQRIMKLGEDDAHIALFTEEQCRYLVDRLNELGDDATRLIHAPQSP